MHEEGRTGNVLLVVLDGERVLAYLEMRRMDDLSFSLSLSHF